METTPCPTNSNLLWQGVWWFAPGSRTGTRSKAHKALWTRFCGQHLFNENGAQFYSYLVKRFWLGVALYRNDFGQITVQKNIVFKWAIIGANHVASLEVFSSNNRGLEMCKICRICGWFCTMEKPLNRRNVDLEELELFDPCFVVHSCDSCCNVLLFPNSIGHAKWIENNKPLPVTHTQYVVVLASQKIRIKTGSDSPLTLLNRFERRLNGNLLYFFFRITGEMRFCSNGNTSLQLLHVLFSCDLNKWQQEFYAVGEVGGSDLHLDEFFMSLGFILWCVLHHLR